MEELMTKELFIEIMEKESGDWEGDNAYQGLKILEKYTSNLIQGAGHDVIWSEDIEKLIERGITKEDVEELRRLNWMLEDETYLSCFV
jgi:hypothetical protein